MSRRERQRRRRHEHGGVRRKILLGLAVIGAVAAVGVVGLVGYVISIAESAPSINALRPIVQPSSSIVYASGGERLGLIQFDELRSPVPAAEIPQSLRDATVAIEDQRFFKHKGVDYEGVVRAAIKNLRSGKTVQGGSTITMQLVRNLYIANPKRNFERKIREAKLAQELEDERSKAWILTTYLNTVSYGTVGGQTAVGVQAAARTFFNKPAQQLTLKESATLAGLPQAPSQYNPFKNPVGARERRNEVLRKMAKLGLVSGGAAAAAIAAPLGVRPGTYYTARRESYFFDFVKDELIKHYGVSDVRKGGFKVYTTIDLKLQRAARAAIAGQLNQPGDPSSAIVSIDPATGHIRAMASSGGYGSSQFNLAAQGHRQAGSTFKVMVLMAALRRGVNPNSTYYTSKPLKLQLDGGPPWEVQTYSNTYGGTMNLVTATLKSDNTVYAQLDVDVGPDQVKQTAQDMGITTKLDGYPAEGLGGLTRGVSPLEMANAYATIASGGWRNKPIAITRVVHANGKVDQLGKPQRTRAFPDGVTYEATRILRQNVLGGTGTRANIGCPAAGKTGTVDDFTDAWFVGFTPKLATSVWIGYPKAKTPMTSVHGISVAGGTFPAAIWHDYMMVAKGADCSDFAQPTEPFVSAPFFGKYSVTGAARSPVYPAATVPGTTTDPTQAPGTGGATDPKSPYNDPRKYASPPQATPKPTPAPRVTPAPQGGTGGAAPTPSR